MVRTDRRTKSETNLDENFVSSKSPVLSSLMKYGIVSNWLSRANPAHKNNAS